MGVVLVVVRPWVRRGDRGLGVSRQPALTAWAPPPPPRSHRAVTLCGRNLNPNTRGPLGR